MAADLAVSCYVSYRPPLTLQSRRRSRGRRVIRRQTPSSAAHLTDLKPLVRTFSTSSRAHEARRSGRDHGSWEAPRAASAKDPGKAQQLCAACSPSLTGTCGARASAAFLWPCGPRRRRRALTPRAADLANLLPSHESALARELQERGHPSGARS